MSSIRYNGFRLWVRTNDHPPPHVHVSKGGGELEFVLGDSDEEPRPGRMLAKMKKIDARNALDAVKANQKALLAMWSEIHESGQV